MIHIRKASAGSGKTYHLTLNYLKFLLDKEDNYKHILAVTFTNKATEEMKRRIINELALLAHETQKSSYVHELCLYKGCNEHTLSATCGKTLSHLLHDFSAFQVSTIDRFFQQITRAMTRELGLQGGYNIEIDDKEVLREAIDLMLFSLDEDPELLQWLIQFSLSNIDNEENWNLRRSIETLAQEILKESYKRHRYALQEITNDKKAMSDFVAQLAQTRRSYEQRLVEIGIEGIEVIAKANIEASDFVGGSRSSFFIFERLKNGAGLNKVNFSKWEELHDNLTAWSTKSASPARKESIRLAYEGGLNNVIGNLLSAFADYPTYNSTLEALRHFYTLGILGDISRHITAYEKEHNLLLLSDTTELLHNIINESDTPFIYEKVGTRINHYMIDEFQDTSQMQWKNFYPLVRESLANNHNNLVVGDVKQSIYRFRNSDWQLLNSDLCNYFPTEQRQVASLDTNWRSDRRIVEFNNSFFTFAAQRLQHTITTEITASPAKEGISQNLNNSITAAYADIYQRLPADKQHEERGYIHLSFIDKTGASQADEAAESKKEKWTEEVLRRIPPLVRELQDRNIPLSKIAFLVRRKSEGVRVANLLLQCQQENTDTRYRYDIISDEALLLSSSTAVQRVIALLRYIDNPSDKNRQLLASCSLLCSTGEKKLSEALAIYLEGESTSAALFDETTAEKLRQIAQQPLFTAIEECVHLLYPTLPSEEQAFVQAFEDVVIRYTARHNDDLSAFVRWWESYGEKKTLFTSTTQEAMRILTIHKSKGLEFHTVIIPFADWDMDHRHTHNNIIWCEPQSAPFDTLPLIPVKYGSSLERSIFAGDYFVEKTQAYIENINLAYVAFTRARSQLFLFTPYVAGKEKGAREGVQKENTLSVLLRNSVLPSLVAEVDPREHIIALNTYYHPHSECCIIGSPDYLPPSEAADSATLATRCTPGTYTSTLGRLRLRMRGADFFNAHPTQAYGLLMHEILSRIEHPSEVDQAVKNSQQNGEINTQEAADLQERLHALLAHPLVADWFGTRWQVMNERDIILPGGSTLRPDRILLCGGCITLIDYKFGKHRYPAHHRQMRNYMQLFAQMGYKQVEGFLWYVSLMEIEKISPQEGDTLQETITFA